jgi:hypothetical protein
MPNYNIGNKITYKMFLEMGMYLWLYNENYTFLQPFVSTFKPFKRWVISSEIILVKLQSPFNLHNLLLQAMKL